MNVSDRRVSYAPHDWSNSYVKSVERVKERFGRESGVFSEQENTLREYSLTA